MQSPCQRWAGAPGGVLPPAAAQIGGRGLGFAAFKCHDCAVWAWPLCGPRRALAAAIMFCAASGFFVVSPYRLCLDFMPAPSALTRRPRTWGLYPQTPRIYRFTATGTPAGIELLPRRIGLRWEPSRSASLRPGPSAVAVPYGPGGAPRGAAWLACAGGSNAANPGGLGEWSPRSPPPRCWGHPQENRKGLFLCSAFFRRARPLAFAAARLVARWPPRDSPLARGAARVPALSRRASRPPAVGEAWAPRCRRP